MEIVRPIVQECFIPAQYTSSPKIIKNCLQEVLSEGMMYSQVSTPADNEDMTKKQRENIIKKHLEQFTTKYYESDRRWHSFLPDETHPHGMKPIAKRKWKDLEAVILAYYEEQEQTIKRKKITLRTLYPEWFAYKWQDTNNSGYMNLIDGEWKRYYENDPIVDRPVVDFTTLDLKNWARNKIITEKLNKKQYYNMAIIIRQSLEYLVELGELPCNHFAEFKIKASLFTPVIPKEAQQEVFTEAEEKKLKALAAAEFAEHPNRTAALAVLINFSLGLRVGELVALKWKDLKDAMEFAGHRDVKTFIDHYCFSRYSDEQKRQELEKTLSV